MDLHLITPPTGEPVSLETAKAYLRVDGTDEDATIALLLSAARERGETLARRAFISQTWELTTHCFPSDLRLQLYRPPLISVTSVKYRDINNVEYSWTDYVLDTNSEPGVIIFKTLPGATLQRSGAVTVRYVAGYGDVETAVPERLKLNILALTAYWFENREAQDVPPPIKKAFMAERAVWF